MKALYAVLGVFIGFNATAQIPDWSTSIASIIYNNCVECHRSGGIAPFSLASYESAVAFAPAIQLAVVTKHMPPWPADPSYRRFANEALLEQWEIDAISIWVANGTPLGDESLAPPPPVFSPTGSLLDTIDYVVAIQPYTLQSNNEEYRWFVVQPNFTDTVFINQIEVMPGLEQLVHHADISYDLTGNSLAFDLADPLPGFNSATGYPTYSFYMNAWQPGDNIVKYPPNWGIAVPPGAVFVLEIHYGPGGAGLVDSTKMNLRFVTNPSQVRPVKVQWTLTDSPPILIDGPLMIPANTVKTFHQVSYPLSSDKSFLSICPHMHLLGKSYRVWYKTPAGDSVPLINIPHWDFHWQRYYTFQKIEKIPAGSIIYSEGVYDNTTGNPHNPNSPPLNVYKGPYTTDEMFLCYFIFTDYQPGDEDIIMDSTLLDIASPKKQIDSTPWWINPNPANDVITIRRECKNGCADAFAVTRDLQGREVMRTKLTEMNQRIDVRGLPSNVYVVTIEGAMTMLPKKLVLVR